MICFMLTSLVYLQERNVKKSKKLMKITLTKKIFIPSERTTRGNSMKFSGIMCLTVILKITK